MHSAISQQVTAAELLRMIRSSRCKINRRGQHKKRVGIYGDTLNHAIERLARKAVLAVSVVRRCVKELIAQGMATYAHNRLVPTKRAQKSASQATVRKNIISFGDDRGFDQLILNDRWLQLSTESARAGLRRQAWSEYYAAA